MAAIEPRADRGLFIFLIALLVWAPIPFSSDHIWSQALLIMGVALVLGGWLVLYLTGRVAPTPALKAARIPLILLVLVQAWVALQILPLGLIPARPLNTISIVPAETFHMLLVGLALCGAFACTLLLVRTEFRVRAVLWAFVLSGVIQATYGTLMVLSGMELTFFLEKPSFRGSNVGTMIYRNQQAGYLVLCLAAGVGLMLSDMKGGATSWRRWLSGFSTAVVSSKGMLRVCLIICVAGLIMTKSRMGNSSFAVGLLLAGLLFVLSRKETRVGGLIFLASIVIIDIVVLGTFFDLEQVGDRLLSTDMDSEQRVDVNPMMWIAAQSYLWFGSGLGSFYAAFPAFKTQFMSSVNWNHGHNDYLQFLVEIGLIGSALLAAFWLVVLVRAVRAIVSSRRSLVRGCGFGVTLVLVAIAMHSVVDYNLQATGYAFSLLVLVATLYCAQALSKQKNISN